MARLLTSGAELGGVTAEGFTPSAPAPTVQSANVRSGAYAYRFAANQGAYIFQAVAPAGATLFMRIYVYLTAYPPSGATAASLLALTAPNVWFGGIVLSNTGVVKLQNFGGGAVPGGSQVGSNGPTLSLNQWYMIELGAKVGTGATDYLEGRVDGVSFASSTTLSITDTQPATAIFGVGDQTASPTMAFDADDLAMNDSSGSSQNSWCGPGKIVILKPTSDNSRAGFGVGAGTNQATTTNLFEAVNNEPETGVAIASSTTGTQIKDKANNSTDQYTANLAAYTTAVASGGGGLVSTDVVMLVQSLLAVGQDSATATSFGATVTNPTVAEATGSGPAAIAGTSPTNWTRLRGAVQYAPSVTLATQPTLKVRKNTSSSTITQMVDLMALVVEFVPQTLYTDGPSGTDTISGSITATHVFTDSRSGTETATGSNTEASTRLSTPSGTETITGTNGEANTRQTSQTGTITPTGSNTNTHVFTEGPSGTVTPSGSNSDASTRLSTPSGTESITGTNAEASTRASSPSGTESISGTNAESSTHSQSPSGTVTPSGSNTNGHVFNESCSGTVAPGGSNGEACTRASGPTGTVTISGTSTDAMRFSDGPTGTNSPTGSRTESIRFSDGPSGTVAITGTNSDTYSTGPITYTDSPVGTLTISGSMGESSTRACSPTGTVTITGTHTESISFSDGPTGAVTPSGTRTESIRFSDGPAGSLVPTGTVTDALAFSDTMSGTNTPSGTQTDSLTFTDSDTGAIAVTGSITEIYFNPNIGAPPDIMEGSLVFWVPKGSAREVRLTSTGVRTIAHGVSERTFGGRSGRSTVEVES